MARNPTSFPTILSSTCKLLQGDGTGYAVLAVCTGVPPTTADVFQHGCIMNRIDSGTGTNAVYQNTGSIAVPSWTLFDTGTEQDATVLVDSNGVISLSIGTTASAVNGLVVTNSATGAVGANAVTIIPGAPSGSDAAISLSIAPKGVTGILTLGKSDGTGQITVGSSSGAQTLVLGGGAGVSTVQIAGGSAANVVTIANVQTAGSLTMGNAMTTGTIQIGGASMTSGGTTIFGGTGTGAITMTPGTAGTIVIGKTDGTGEITLGSSSGTQVVNVGTGAGVSTVNLATVSVAGANINMATAVTGAGVTDTISIATGNAAATGIKVVNIATGVPVTSGNNRVRIGGGVTTTFSVNALFRSYQAVNYVTATGANNALEVALVDASGTNITLAAGLRMSVNTSTFTLQAGGNTIALNGGATKAIKKHTNVASDIGTAYAAASIIEVIYDGTQWLDLSQ